MARRDDRPCANPLFVEWLSEWRDEADNKGLKSAHTYNRAVRSLKKYPLMVATGKDCKILENFGDKIGKMLDDRLAKYSADTDDALAAPGDPPNPNAQRRRQVAGAAGGNRPYVPAYRSGAYALLLTLYNTKQIANHRGYMTKQELMREAQTLADKSFKRPDPGSHYTAWSSMGTLIVKGYIIRASCPAKYSITDSGCELAARMSLAKHDVSCSSVDNDDCTSVLSHHQAPTHHTWAADEANDDCTLVQSPHTWGVGTAMSGCAVTEDLPLMERLGRKKQSSHKTTPSLPSMHVAESHSGCSTTDGTAKSYKLSTSSNPGDHRTAKNIDMANKRLAAIEKRNNTPATITIDESDIPAPDEISRKRLCSETSTVADAAPSSARTKLTTGEMKRILEATSPSSKSKQNNAGSATYTQDDGSRNETGGGGTGSATCSQDDALWEMAPYSYDIFLCVDNCELQGGASDGRDVLLRELKKNNVAHVVRKLQVGDFLWVAKDNTGKHGGVELMLDYIVERKRMDDLAGSIIDGRFHEQKFRLRNSGVNNVIYLIETFGSNQHLSIAEDSLNQAIVNTQVIDGFHIKHTGSTRESAAYLTLMTRYLQSFYGGKALSCGTSNRHGQFITFQDFNNSTVKTKAMTVTEMFAKHLLQLHGMTADKALAITQSYPTPTRLLEAYSSKSSKYEKEALLAGVRCGPLHRPLGASLSKMLCMLYSTETALR